MIGLWTQHHPGLGRRTEGGRPPSLSRNLSDSGTLDRPGSFSRKEGFAFYASRLETRIIPGEEVLGTMEELHGI